MKIILASQSPRRKELLTLMGLPYTAIPCDLAEIPPQNATTEETVMALARQKARAVAALHPEDCVIGADTVVDLDGRILGKPYTPERAKEYLKLLSGRSHIVYTGVCVITSRRELLKSAATKVTFRSLTEEEIEWYVSTGDPLDKAGSYGVQGPACILVDRIEGNYFNVIGMPVPLLYEMLIDARVIDHSRCLL